MPTICFKENRYYLGSYTHFKDVVIAQRAAEEKLRDKFLREFTETASQEAADG